LTFSIGALCITCRNEAMGRAVALGFVLMPEPLAKVPRRLIGPIVFLC
jgi:hypothetical protein